MNELAPFIRFIANLTNEPSLVDAAATLFDSVWQGAYCRVCGRKEYCLDPIKA